MVFPLVRIVRGQPPLAGIARQPLHHRLALVIEGVHGAVDQLFIQRVDDHDVVFVQRGLHAFSLDQDRDQVFGAQVVALDPVAAHAEGAAVAAFGFGLEAGDAGRQAQLDHRDLHEFTVVVVGGAHGPRIPQPPVRRWPGFAFTGHQPDVGEAELAFDIQRVADVDRLDLTRQPLIDDALGRARGFDQAGLPAFALQGWDSSIDMFEAVG